MRIVIILIGLLCSVVIQAHPVQQAGEQAEGISISGTGQVLMCPQWPDVDAVGDLLPSVLGLIDKPQDYVRDQYAMDERRLCNLVDRPPSGDVVLETFIHSPIIDQVRVDGVKQGFIFSVYRITTAARDVFYVVNGIYDVARWKFSNERRCQNRLGVSTCIIAKNCAAQENLDSSPSFYRKFYAGDETLLLGNCGNSRRTRYSF